jgi:exopolysaccharide biosynthesis polyprenyl glycosylphosphotransferase
MNGVVGSESAETEVLRQAQSAAAGLSPARQQEGNVSIRQDWLTALFFVGLDVVFWVGIYSTAGFIRHDAFYSAPLQYFMVEAVPLLIVIQAVFIIGGYDRETETRGLTYTAEHVLAMVGALAVSFAAVYSIATFDQSMHPSRAVLLISFVAFTPVSLAYRRIVRHSVAASTAQRAFLVIGAGEMAKQFYKTYRESASQQRLEFVDIEHGRAGEHISGPDSPIIESDLETKLDRLGNNYSGVVVAERVDRISPELLQRLVRTQFQNTRVYTLESFYEAHWKRVPVRSIDPFWPLQMGFQLARSSLYHYVKRLMDVILAGALLVISSPLIVAITWLIWWRNGKPALFRQERVGRDEQVFWILKFRTMHHQSPDQQEEIYTRAGDPRITGVGRWLRKLRLDELPQLWNVLRGDMSLIGPRAEWTKCAERYEKTIPFYHFRHLVKPGITGWAQVSYPYGESDEDAIEKLKYDLYYIRHYSLTLDAMILLKTVHTMLFGRGR